MTKLEQMQSKLASLIKTMQDHIDADRLDEAEQVKTEIISIKNKISQQIFVDELEAETFKETAKTIPQNQQTKSSASFVRACIKKFSNNPISEDERDILVQNSLVLPNTTYPNGANGEAYILPEDIRTIITRKIREYRSFRDVLGIIKTTALSGAFPVENLDSITGLIDFEDGTDGVDSYTPSGKDTTVEITGEDIAKYLIIGSIVCVSLLLVVILFAVSSKNNKNKGK